MHILLVEDDQAAGSALAAALRAHHSIVELAIDGQMGLELAQRFEYDLLVLDLLLPKIDGISLCRQLRSQGCQTPILLLTARDSSTDRIMGLDAGADDYIVKPYNFSELMARIRAVVRRGHGSSGSVLSWENLSLDLSTTQAKYGETSLRLTAKEYSILELFLLYPQRVFSRSVILDRLWDAADSPGEEVVTTHVKVIRQKLAAAGAAKDFIETLYGLGYRLNPTYQPPAKTQPPAETTLAAPSIPEQAVSQKAASQKTASQKTASQKNSSLKAVSHKAVPQTSPIAPTPAPTQPASPSPQQIEAAMLGLWQRFKGTFATQVEQLAQTAIDFAQALSIAQPTTQPSAVTSFAASFVQQFAEQRQAAQQIAHKLAGSLGVFGYANGSVLARQIEELLLGTAPLDGEKIQQMQDWVTLLQEELSHAPVLSESPSIATASPTATALPDAEASTAATHAASPFERLDRSTSAPFVLVIDDDRALTEALKIEAAAWNFRVDIADHPAIARKMIDRTRPDAILLDLTFSDLTDGLGLLRQLAEERSQIPVVVFTGRNELSDRVEVVRLGGQAFLQKPVASDRIFQTLQQVLQQTLHPEPPPTGKVLVVDDDPAILAIVHTLLEPWGLQLKSLADPQQFWTVLEQCLPDLLILDISMPTFSGIELCQVVRHDPNWGTLPILFLTAHTESEWIQNAFAAGADDYIRKPIEASELVTRVISRLDRLRLQRRRVGSA